MSKRKTSALRTTPARASIPEPAVTVAVYQRMHAINEGIERAMQSMVEPSDNPVFDMPPC